MKTLQRIGTGLPWLLCGVLGTLLVGASAGPTPLVECRAMTIVNEQGKPVITMTAVEGKPSIHLQANNGNEIQMITGESVALRLTSGDFACQLGVARGSSLLSLKAPEATAVVAAHKDAAGMITTVPGGTWEISPQALRRVPAAP